MSSQVEILPLARVDKAYTYAVSEKLKDRIKPGQLVLIPLAKREVEGIVWSEAKDKQSRFNLKPVKKILDGEPVLNEKQIALTKWLADYYLAPLGIAVKLMVPKIITRLPKDKAKLDKPQEFHKLTPGQTKAFAAISRDPGPFLLHGITASGKTEIYLHLARDIIKKGKQVIILVPEISLTPQAINIWTGRFPGKVAVWHSRLSPGERYKNWLDIRSGKIKIVIGPRSAVFAPVKDLGLVVLDEEHDQSYKQFELSPRYHAREVALQLAGLHGAKLILGDATPSVETYYKARQGKFEILELPERISRSPLPPVNVINLNEERDKDGINLFSRELAAGLKKVVANKRQAILFLNRRGLATLIMCRKCGEVLSCPNCKLPLIYHGQQRRSGGNLYCHHCRYTQNSPALCPKCHSPEIYYLGRGTERVELELKKLIPHVRILRLDKDTTRSKHSLERIYDDFKDGKADILIGTQMLTKGLDLPKVDLIGIIAADSNFYFPDFKSRERAFQLLTQVAGRAGRLGQKSKVILQTYHPYHPVIKFASAHDFKGFYEAELKERKLLNYPPFTKLAKLVFRHKDEEMAELEAKKMAKQIQKKIEAPAFAPSGLRQGKKKITLLGPVPAFIPQKRGYYYWQIVLKGDDFGKILKNIPPPWQIDIDPDSLL